LISKHKEAPHLRQLQKVLAEEVTTMVHGKEELENAIKASEVLFGKSTAEDLRSLDASTFMAVFEGVPQATITRLELAEGLNIVDALTERSHFLRSKSEARRELQSNAMSVNKEQVSEDYQLTEKKLLANQYVLLQKG